ncbi:hypothetical protein L596_010156 [Steinernema carpocapsae]|nr:hypothetical protein L596_010156 [Steinernema carpocapsae]
MKTLLVAACLVFLGVALANHHSSDPLADADHLKGGEHDKNYDHKQFLDPETAAEFDELTPEKSKERLAKLVPKMDSDSDGFIEENELREHITFMQKRYVNNDVDRTWKNYKDEKVKDGKLSWKDYREMVYGHPDGEGQELSRNTKRWLRVTSVAGRWLTTIPTTFWTAPSTAASCTPKIASTCAISSSPKPSRTSTKTRTALWTSTSTSATCTALKTTLSSTERSPIGSLLSAKCSTSTAIRTVTASWTKLRCATGLCLLDSTTLMQRLSISSELPMTIRTAS